MTPGRRLVRSVAWRRLDVAGTEHCRLWEDDGRAWRLDGVAVLADGDVPYSIRYEVRCDARFATRRATVAVALDDEVRTLSLRTRGGRWVAQPSDPPVPSGSEDLPQVEGCIDVDLGFTPSTNTLPVRRLSLAVGARAEVDAAWVRFPDLDVQRLPQRYTRLAERRYRYESLDSGFAAHLEMDEQGLVVTYEGLWERVGSSDG